MRKHNTITLQATAITPCHLNRSVAMRMKTPIRVDVKSFVFARYGVIILFVHGANNLLCC
jgi:hypothetical protein